MNVYLRSFVFFIHLVFILISKVVGQSGFIHLSDYLPANHVRDASVDYTDKIQHVLDNNKKIIFPNYPLLINQKGLKLSSDTHLKFLENGSLILSPTNTSQYSVLAVVDVENIIVENVEIIGDRDNHIGEKGEWGMGIYIIGSNNVQIENAKISKCWGDGISIKRSKTKNSKSVYIKNSSFSKNRRNGITIGSGENIKIENVKFESIDGTLPMAGIDIEPDSNLDKITNITISNVETRNCNIGIQIGLRHYPAEYKRNVRISIDGLKSSNDNHGMLIGDYFRESRYGKNIKPLNGSINIKNVNIINPSKEPIKVFSPNGYSYSPAVIFENIEVENANQRIEEVKTLMEKRKFNIKRF